MVMKIDKQVKGIEQYSSYLFINFDKYLNKNRHIINIIIKITIPYPINSIKE